MVTAVVTTRDVDHIMFPLPYHSCYSCIVYTNSHSNYSRIKKGKTYGHVKMLRGGMNDGVCT